MFCYSVEKMNFYELHYFDWKKQNSDKAAGGYHFETEK